MKFLKRNTQAQQREAIAQGRSLSPYRLRYTNKFCDQIVKTQVTHCSCLLFFYY
ncbi:MAG: hypothetical protein LBJ00_01570 [Planctomycetaceae bacterium]|nr:hypothetical protein [Planctomycetaceae bacterium]